MVIFVYDGDCGFCTSAARFLARRAPAGAQVVAWQQADLAALGLTEAAAAAAVQLVGPQWPALAGPDAVGALLRVSPRRGWRLAGRALGLRPVRAVAWPVYRWVSRHRHRFPGGTAACALPAGRRPDTAT